MRHAKLLLAVACASGFVSGCQTGADSSNPGTKDYSNLAGKGYLSILRAGTIQNSRSSSLLAACHSQIPNLISAEQFNSILEEGGKLKGGLSESITKTFRVDIAADPAKIGDKDGELTCTFTEAQLERKSLDSLRIAIAQNKSQYENLKKEFLAERMPLVQEAIQINEEIKLLREELRSTL